MIETPPLSQMLAAPPRRDWRIGMTAAASALVHLGILGWLLLPALQPVEQPAPPAPINVELVPPSAVSSTPPPPSSEQPSSSELPSSEQPVSSEQPSMEPASSGVSEPASSAEASSAASESPASAASEASASGVNEAAGAPSASSEAPVPAPRPILIPVAPDEPSSEQPAASAETAASEMPAASAVTTSSAPQEEAPSVLATTDPGADTQALASSAPEQGTQASEAPSEEPPPPPVIDGALHVAKRFYLANMLQGPEMANAREAIKKLPPQKRLVQTCNIEAIAQIGQASGHQPDAIVADAFAPTQPSERTFKVTAGAFRSNKTWYAVSYDCTLSKDLSKVQSFSFRIGDEVSLPSRAPAQVKQGGG